MLKGGGSLKSLLFFLRAAFLLLITGLAIGFSLSALYGAILFAGFFIDFVIYTIWLKRISAWSIVWGGISGGMPVLAGRVLGLGSVDWIGLLLSLAVLLWIPTHIMTFNIKYYKDYERARIPTFASSYGLKATRVIIAFSAITSALAFGLGAFLMGLSWGYLRVLIIIAVILISYSVYCLLKPGPKVNYHIFKIASIYMVIVMLIIILGALL
ncbi:MAG: UbiA family prenyltransferase [Bacteroidales bacterium]|nr:UbiA family prenyltransferase [Bacteroidales bacterium]MBN2699018.1 UbiA family prenyltransferase [Bacteroidales bacterium]